MTNKNSNFQSTLHINIILKPIRIGTAASERKNERIGFMLISEIWFLRSVWFHIMFGGNASYDCIWKKFNTRLSIIYENECHPHEGGTIN